MAKNDVRKKNRRGLERRQSERRVIADPFGSPEWCRLIEQQYLLWPKEDRRQLDRRHEGRRQSRRRIKNIGPQEQKKILQNILTDEEKKMITELIQSDQSD